MTASLKRGRPVAPPVSRAIAAIPATIRARGADCPSCAAQEPTCVTASKRKAQNRIIIMRILRTGRYRKRRGKHGHTTDDEGPSAHHWLTRFPCAIIS
jgi:hypothetical protein